MTDDRIHEIVREVAERRAALIEAFVVEYLRRSGERIEDLSLCEQQEFVDGKAVTKWWLQPKYPRRTD